MYIGLDALDANTSLVSTNCLSLHFVLKLIIY
jgi:hypothetical protein